MTRGVCIREARLDEVLPLRHAVLRSGLPPDSARFVGDEHARHWLAESDGAIVGVASVFAAVFEDRTHQLRGMAVSAAVRGQGIGLVLLRAVEVPYSRALWCNARTSAEGFYARAGWRTVSQVFEIKDVGPHVKMLGP